MGKDYVGAGASEEFENLDFNDDPVEDQPLETEEEPVKAPVKKKAPEAKEPEENEFFDEEEEEEEEEEDTSKGKKKKEDPEEEEVEEEEQEEQEFTNMVDFIDKKFNLGLNTGALPKEMTRQQEAVAMERVLGRIINNANEAIAEYKEIEELLEDEEIAKFLEAKRNKVSLRDFASQYVQSKDGMSSYDVVKAEYKEKHPHLDEETIEDMIETLKKKDKLDSMADNVRKSWKDNEQKELLAREEQEKAEEQQRREEIIQEQKKYATLLQSKKEINGVPLTDDIRKNLYIAATQPDKEGMTYLDKALQSNEGILNATIGLLYLEHFINAGSTIKSNRKSKHFADKLFDKPDKLQSGSKARHVEFDPEAANSF